MKTSDFDYFLPTELIAQTPIEDRSASRMMVVHRSTGIINHDYFRNIGSYLSPGDLLVLNNTKVIPARLWAMSPSVEVLLVEQLQNNCWSALIKPVKKTPIGKMLVFENQEMSARVEAETNFGGRILQFFGNVQNYMETYGAAPLPPYIRDLNSRDRHSRERYQTIFASSPGAIAAPTAGLHFTQSVLDALLASGVNHTFITLHVGIGTFRPVKVDDVENHQMHSERFSISDEASAKIHAAKRVVSVGTTVVRALESVHEQGPYEGVTDLFIYPPFKFRRTDLVLTNFHLPQSTLLMLVSAFASRELILRAYGEAVAERYRFFSFGDCMLIL